MRLESPALFGSRREFAWFAVIMLVIISGRLAWEYHRYRSFVSQPFVYTKATVLNVYPRQNDHRSYTVLKVRDDHGKRVYITAYRNDLLRGDRLYLKLFPSETIGFWNYLGGMYCKSRIQKVTHPHKGAREKIESAINAQHADEDLQEFYRAIFLATPLSPSLRNRIASLGVSHLVALSGFHLGILWAVLYPIFLWPYRLLVQRRRPYRHALFDVGIVVMILLGAYVFWTGNPPALLRAYVMLFLGWLMVLAGIELVSFPFLLTIVLFLSALFPAMLVSLGFWLSVAGVFYIFLILDYCKAADKRLVALGCIPVGIFVLMQPIVHSFFPMTTPWQLLSPLLSLGFVLFYPLAFVLHLLGAGGVLDGPLRSLFSLNAASEEHLLPVWAAVAYLVLSLGAIGRRKVFWVLGAVATGYGVYLFG